MVSYHNLSLSNINSLVSVSFSPRPGVRGQSGSRTTPSPTSSFQQNVSQMFDCMFRLSSGWVTTEMHHQMGSPLLVKQWLTHLEAHHQPGSNPAPLHQAGTSLQIAHTLHKLHVSQITDRTEEERSSSWDERTYSTTVEHCFKMNHFPLFPGATSSSSSSSSSSYRTEWKAQPKLPHLLLLLLLEGITLSWLIVKLREIDLNVEKNKKLRFTWNLKMLVWIISFTTESDKSHTFAYYFFLYHLQKTSLTT